MVAGLLLALLLAGCAAEPGARDAAPAPYPDVVLTWVSQARDGTAVLHRGDDEQRAPSYVEAIWPTAYGVVVQHRSGPGLDASQRTSLVTPEGTERLPGEVSDVKVSPDGRYVGWVDYAGPQRIGYRLAEAVVLDLGTGEEVLRDHRRMGGWRDQDLYSEQYPEMYGFDADGFVYWRTAKAGDDGSRILRADVGTGEVSAGGRTDSAEGGEQPRGRIVDAVLGEATGMSPDGTASPDGTGEGGYVSPDGRWCLTGGLGTTLRVVDCETAAVVTPRRPDRRLRFAGWAQGSDAYYVLAAPRGLDVVLPPGERDRSRGVLARCELPRGRCVVEERVRRLGSLVLPVGFL